VTDQALLVAPLACSVVLLVSGVAKTGDTDGTRAAFISMGVPSALTTPFVARALPYAELALGLLLLAAWGWALVVVAAVAAVLFATYWVLVARVLRRGEDVDCACFGALGEGRVSGWTLGRNTLLVALGALAVVHGAAGGGALPDIGDLDRAGWLWLAMTVIVAATAALVVGRGSQPAPAEADLLDYDRAPIPFAMLEDEAGRQLSLRQLAATRPHLLVFLSPGCGACVIVAPRLGEWPARLGPVEVDAIFTQSLDSLPETFAWESGVTRWVDVQSGATDTFAAAGRPAAVLLGADGQLAGGPVSGSEAIAAFVQDIAAELEEAEAAAVEDPEPAAQA